MRFGYTLDGAGWATASMGNAGQDVTMTVSYLHDSLAQLVEASLALQTGQDESAVIFMDEPGEHHVVSRRQADDSVVVQVRWYDDWASWGMHPVEAYEVVFECHSSSVEIRELVIVAARRLLTDHGLKGYKESWLEHEFPTAAYRKLLGG